MPENELNARIRTPPPKWLLALAAFVAGAGLELGGATRPLLARFFFIVAAIVTYWEIWARSKNFRSAERKIVRASSAPALIIATLLAAQYLAPNPEPTENIVQQVLNGVEALFKKYATEKPVATEPVPKQPPERPA
ncbi:MAG: hypothetical protein FJ295_22040, partial [Planctomycetes bacterium]|nr:hypothetical protein [Planctomycetota bacterium]